MQTKFQLLRVEGESYLTFEMDNNKEALCYLLSLAENCTIQRYATPLI